MDCKVRAEQHCLTFEQLSPSSFQYRQLHLLPTFTRSFEAFRRASTIDEALCELLRHIMQSRRG